MAAPSTVKVKKGTSTIDVTVAAAGFTPEGFVAAYVDGEFIAAPLTDGKATLTVVRSTPSVQGDRGRLPGDAHQRGCVDHGDGHGPEGRAEGEGHGPTTAKVRKATPKVTVTVSADGIAPTGTVVFRVDGLKVATKSLSGGRRPSR